MAHVSPVRGVPRGNEFDSVDLRNSSGNVYSGRRERSIDTYSGVSRCWFVDF